MALAEDIGNSVVAVMIKLVPGLERQWHVMIPGPEKDRIFTELVLSIRGHIRQDRMQHAGFIDWWAERAHKDHMAMLPAGTTPDWKQCPTTLCISLLGTLQEYLANADPAQA